MKRRIVLLGVVCLAAIYLWAGLGDLIASFDRSGREQLRYLLGAVAWLGGGGCAVTVAILRLLARSSDVGPAVREIAVEEGTRRAFVFRVSPAWKPLVWVGGFALALATVGLIAVGRGQTVSGPQQLSGGVLNFTAWLLLVPRNIFPSRLALTERGVVFASVGSGSGFIPWDSIESARLITRRHLPFLELRVRDSAGVESPRSSTRKAVSRRGAVLVWLDGFRTSPQVVGTTVSHLLEHPEDRPKIGTGEGLHLIGQSP
jgi:hypothetical protein